MVEIMITTKAEAVLELVNLREKMRKAGVKILKADTYEFIADDGMLITRVYWSGGFIVSDISFKN